MTKPESFIFGLGGTSLTAASSAYFKWLKKKKRPFPVVQYTSPGAVAKPSSNPKVSRLLLMDGVSTLFVSRANLGPLDRVLVADSPVLLSEVPALRVLDITPNPTALWSFQINPFDPSDFHSILSKSIKTPFDISTLGWTKLDQLGMVIEDTSAGNLVTPIKAISAQLDHTTRPRFRTELGRWATGKSTPAELDTFLSKRLGDTTLAAALRKDLKKVMEQYQPLMIQLVPLMLANKSTKKLMDGTDLTLFEVKFILRTVKEDNVVTG